jgi:hypothetical protein
VISFAITEESLDDYSSPNEKRDFTRLKALTLRAPELEECESGVSIDLRIALSSWGCAKRSPVVLW